MIQPNQPSQKVPQTNNLPEFPYGNVRQVSVLPTGGSPVPFPLATAKTRIQASDPLPSAARRVTTHCFEMPLLFFQV
jgi:hypothetical protein